MTGYYRLGATYSRLLHTLLIIKLLHISLGSTAAPPPELQVVQTQCQCTCPIGRHLLRDPLVVNEDQQALHDDDPISTKNIKVETTTGSNVRPTYAEPSTVSSRVTVEGSGLDDDPFATNYYVDHSDEEEQLTVDIRRHKTRADIIDNPDDEQMFGQPMAAKASESVIAGPKGQKGEAGVRGMDGYDGKSGIDGVPGEPGEDGISGEAGFKGVKGDKGDQGPRGYPGSVGLQGYRGPPGSIGEPGRQGPRGGDGTRGTRGEQGVMGQRGLPGKPGLKGESGQPGAPGKDSATSQNKVAFLVRLSDHFGPSTITTHIIFPQVDINLGSGFDSSSGSFLAPVDGVYVLHLQVMAMADHIAWLALQVNGEPVAYAWASGYTSAVEQMGTAMTIQQLKRGDVTNIVQKASVNPPNYLYAHYTLFSGYLIG